MQEHPNDKDHSELDRRMEAEANAAGNRMGQRVKTGAPEPKSALPNESKHEPTSRVNSPKTDTQPKLADQSKPLDSSANKTPLPAKRTQRDAELAAALRKMITKLEQGQNRHFMVGLVGYFIEGIPYGASCLSLDPVATPEVQITDEGFSCIAFFPPNILVPSTVRKNGIITVQFGGPPVAAVRVRVDVRAKDIISVAEFLQRKQHNLFIDPDPVARLSAFRSDTQAWSDQ